MTPFQLPLKGERFERMKKLFNFSQSLKSPSPTGRAGEGVEGLHSEILRIAIPSIVTNITVPLLGMFDLAIAGHIGSASVIGAISVGGLIFNMVYWLFNFLRMGSSGLTAQAFGRGDVCSQRGVLRLALTISIIFGLLIFALQRPIEWFAHIVIQPTDEVWQLAVAYYRIRIWAAPAVLALFALNGWFIGMQNSRYPMFIAIGQNLLNIAASAALVFWGHMGIEGVALGTVISQYAGLIAALCLTQVLLPKSLTSLQGDRLWSFKGLDTGSFFRVNRDIFFRMICLIAVTTAFTSFGARQGDLLLAVNTLLIQLFILFSYFCDGFALAGEALVGRYTGAQQQSNKLACVCRLFVWAGGVTSLFTLIYWIGGDQILRLFTDDAEVLVAAQPYLPWLLLIPVTGFAAFMWDGIYIGATATRQMLYSLAFGAAVFFGIWMLPLPVSANHHLWLSFILYLSGRSLWQTVMARRVLTPPDHPL